MYCKYCQHYPLGFIDKTSVAHPDSSGISSESGWIRIRIQIFMTKNQKKCTVLLEKLFYNFFIINNIFYLFLGQAFIKDVQATGESFSPQKRATSTSKKKNIKFCFFQILVGHFCPPGSGSGSESATLIKTVKRYKCSNLNSSVGSVQYKWLQINGTPKKKCSSK